MARRAKDAKKPAEADESEPAGQDNAQPQIGEYEAAFLDAIRAGDNWFLALLQAVAAWPVPDEKLNDRRYSYVIANEAFDWLVLAERLLDTADGLVPQDERDRLLFEGQPPIPFDNARFRDAIGPVKHGAHLNYLYGVVVEEALQQANIEEVAKARQNLGAREAPIEEEAFMRLYDATIVDLQRDFRRSRGQKRAPQRTSLEDHKVFTYWLFKRRVSRSDPARLASDTLKGIRVLERLRPALWLWSQGETA